MSLFSHPIKKLTLLAALGGGYVLGARAGRERYEQLKQTANQVKDDPRVQQAAAQAQEFVHDTTEKVKEDPRVQDVFDRVEEVAKHATGKAEDVVEQAGDKVEDVVDTVTDQDRQDDAKAKIQEVANAAKAKANAAKEKAGDVKEKTADVNNTSGDSDKVHPLLADEHSILDEEVVYSSGPDIEESIDELLDIDKDEQDRA